MTPSSKSAAARTRITAPHLIDMKSRGEKIVMLTAYDAGFAAQCERAGIDVVLVGDSLGMVVQGRDSTLTVTLGEMVYHTSAAARGIENAMLLADLPFLTYRDVDTALRSAGRLVAEGGAAMVKVEGAQRHVLEVIHALQEHEMPVCAHLGLTPQSVHRFGGYRVQGRSESAADKLVADAHAVAEAGAALLVLECVPATLAQRITAEVPIPTIGIGAGVHCDGQVLVLYDMLGVTPGKRLRFTRDFLAGSGSVEEAMRRYVEAVRAGEFPGPEHSF